MKINLPQAEIDKLYSSGLFDPVWYRNEYPDVDMLGMDPAEHFLWIGQRLGRLGSQKNYDLHFSQQPGHAMPIRELPGLNGYRSIATFNSAERANFVRRLSATPPQREFAYSPKISVLVPAYKSPIQFLDLAVNSVINQSYANWELIIVDDGSASPTLERYLRGLLERDRRIIVQINPTNGGISAATNDCLALATGEFVALFDHDDILTLDALDHYIAALNKQPELDLIYSDECRVDEAGVPIDMFRKPDWSPAMLLNYMYTGHLSVYRRSIVNRVGGFRTPYDFSQDYDLALRVTELTARICHIPELLYGWRAIAGSGAAGGKDFARESNIAALADAMRRRGIAGKAVALPTANRVVRLGCMPEPLVSVIIPSDNSAHITAAISSIIDGTDYPNFEIVVVTNSGIVDALQPGAPANVRFVRFDLPFNFSAKCNAGAYASAGEYYCFFNDDVRPQSRDWIEALLEYGLMADVGAVGAKLLYENGTIQHAGMITGVRNLIGTAFHCLPADTSEYFNMAQCVRDVSLLCGALILMRKDVFHAVGGWDEGAFAIAHSDTDLCLKVWASGQRCVYTPHASLVHIGHVSIGKVEAKAKKRPKEKAEIALLRRWPSEIAADPYFTHAMVRGVYHDAQEYYRVHAGKEFPLVGGRDVLIASHELTQSGAPLLVLEMARQLMAAGHFVTVIAPEDGPMREALTDVGVTVIVDELLFSGHETVRKLCAGFDVVIANTIVTWPLIRSIMDHVPVKWYIHESVFLDHYIPSHGVQFSDLSKQVTVWAVTSVPAKLLGNRGWKYQVVTPGIAEVEVAPVNDRSDQHVEMLILGGYEPRKGQDIAIAMLDHLPAAVRNRVRLRCFGRTVDSEFYNRLLGEVDAEGKQVFLNPALDRRGAQEAIRNADIVLVPSRDESFSLVVIEAMQQGAVVVCSKAVGAAEFLIDGEHAFIADGPTAPELAKAVENALADRSRWPTVREAGISLAHLQFSDKAFGRRLLDAMADVLTESAQAT